MTPRFALSIWSTDHQRTTSGHIYATAYYHHHIAEICFLELSLQRRSHTNNDLHQPIMTQQMRVSDTLKLSSTDIFRQNRTNDDLRRKNEPPRCEQAKWVAALVD